LEQLREEPYASVLCYPRASEAELYSRLEELRNHDVRAVEFSGKAKAFNVPVLGKGYVGVVAIAHLNGQRLALKIRRVDADRADLLHEANMLGKANSVGVGAKMLGVSKNFLLMRLIEGELLPSWIEAYREKALVTRVLTEILECCFRLDAIGLDHGELSKAPKHIIVDPQQKPWIVDFETASDTRKPSNVTAVCHFLFNSAGLVARSVAETMGERNKAEITRVSRIYKNNRTRWNFERVLHACLS
jgi:putative serine/threonine protein kinase